MRFYHDTLLKILGVDDDGSEDEEPEPSPEPAATPTQIRRFALTQRDRVQGNEQDARTFAEGALVSWNMLDDDGKPVPATPDEFLTRLTVAEAGRIALEWLRGMRQAPPPLAAGSESGSTSKEPKE